MGISFEDDTGELRGDTCFSICAEEESSLLCSINI